MTIVIIALLFLILGGLAQGLTMLRTIKDSISDIKRDNERRIEYNKQRNEKRKEFRTNRTDIDKTLKRADDMSKVSKGDKRG